MSAATLTTPPALHPLLERLCRETRAVLLDTSGLDAWAAQPGVSMLVFAEEPARLKETLDIAVVVPELYGAFGRAFRVGLLLADDARAVAPRYGFARWPAFVMLRDGQYLGAVDGIRDWDVYVAEVERLLQSAPTRPPSVGIRVTAAGGSAAGCH
ncbi:hydrogenase [Azohydromonas sediminis]|uniref:hydrogenase n=1 Tax=Azohydromonas sediminis TaxID=2259674 RepID=UPI000E64A98B|nr:hydrogenase [Azohydromonas sediminis]